MKYYLLIENENEISPIIIGETTLGGTLLAGPGWALLEKIIELADSSTQTNLTFLKIKDSKNKTYTVNTFLEKIGNAKVIKQS